jgi:hypothetical protein
MARVLVTKSRWLFDFDSDPDFDYPNQRKIHIQPELLLSLRAG